MKAVPVVAAGLQALDHDVQRVRQLGEGSGGAASDSLLERSIRCDFVFNLYGRRGFIDEQPRPDDEPISGRLAGRNTLRERGREQAHGTTTSAGVLSAACSDKAARCERQRRAQEETPIHDELSLAQKPARTRAK